MQVSLAARFVEVVEPLAEPGAHVVGAELRALTLVPRDDGTSGRHTGEPREAERLPEIHDRRPSSVDQELTWS